MKLIKTLKIFLLMLCQTNFSIIVSRGNVLANYILFPQSGNKVYAIKFVIVRFGDIFI